jgi:hypothetical protein
MRELEWQEGVQRTEAELLQQRAGLESKRRRVEQTALMQQEQQQLRLPEVACAKERDRKSLLKEQMLRMQDGVAQQLRLA